MQRTRRVGAVRAPHQPNRGTGLTWQRAIPWRAASMPMAPTACS